MKLQTIETNQDQLVLFCIITCVLALHDFIVGVTNIDPTVTAPSPGLYTVCATYDGNAPAASTFMLTCSDSSQVDGRYVILYMPFQFDSLIVCEVIVNFNPYSGTCTGHWIFNRML